MSFKLLDRLADHEVPPLPRQFDRQVHQRLNLTLLALHLFDLAIRGVPMAMLQFAQAVWGLIGFSVSGRFQTLPRRDPPARGDDQ